MVYLFFIQLSITAIDRRFVPEIIRSALHVSWTVAEILAELFNSLGIFRTSLVAFQMALQPAYLSFILRLIIPAAGLSMENQCAGEQLLGFSEDRFPGRK
jgi:hypothetical protein